MCVSELRYAFNALAVYNSPLSFTSCWVSQRWEIRAFSDLSFKYAHPSTWMWLSCYPGICQSFLKPSVDISFPSFLSFFWSAFCFPQLVSPLQAAAVFNNSWFFWRNNPVIVIPSLNNICVEGQIKISSVTVPFPRSCHTAVIILWGQGFLGSSRSILLSPRAGRPLFFKLLVFRANEGLGRGRWE